METPAFTPRLSPLDCTPSIPDPLIVFASLSSLTTSHFPSLSHPESPVFARRSWTPPPRLGARCRRHGEPAPPFCGSLTSSCPCAPAEPLLFLSRAAERRRKRQPDLAGVCRVSVRTSPPYQRASDDVDHAIVLATPSRVSSSTSRHRNLAGASPSTTSRAAGNHRGSHCRSPKVRPLSLSPCPISAQRVSARGPAPTCVTLTSQ